MRALLSLTAVWLSLATVASAQRAGSWSPVTDGLRARLVVESPSIAAGETFFVFLEIENPSAAPIAVRVADPFSLAPRLRDAAGHPISATTARMEVLSSPRWAVIAPGRSARFPISIRSADGPSQLDVTTSIWRLPPGRYQLDARFSSSREPGAPARPWSGTFELPAIDLEIR